MQTVLLEKLGVRVSRLGFGGMRFPKGEDGKIDRPAAAALIRRAHEGGVNYFDTAYAYHMGESEPFLREALSPFPRDSYFLADKLPMWLVKSKAQAREIFEEQLARCGTDHFDFYLYHYLTGDRWERAQELELPILMEELRREGKIRFLGFSFHDVPAAFNQIIDSQDWDFAQIQFNYMDDLLMETGELYRKLEERDIPCIVMEPVKGGSLATLPPEAGRHLTDCPAPEAARWPHPAQWAFRWCMSRPNVKVILSGMSAMEQVEQNLELFSTAPAFTAAEAEALDRARDFLLTVKSIPCTACNYCDACPKAVAIPQIFEIYNRHMLYHNDFRSKTNYALLTRDHSARACVNCGKCLPLCPQQIDIPAQLQLVHQAMVEIPIILQDDSPAI